MQGIGSQLSKNVLGMKFMRKTKDELDKAILEEKHRHHFAPESKLKIPSTSSTARNLETIVEEVPSYAQVIGYKFGRISFGGFNPTVEDNVAKGKWKAVHVHPSAERDDDDSDSEPPRKLFKVEKADEDDDEEAVYGSLIATCGKQLYKSGDDSSEGEGEAEEDVPLPQKKRGGWVTRGFRSETYNKNRNGGGGGGGKNRDRCGTDSRKKNKRPQGPPGKKARFMKPSDDF